MRYQGGKSKIAREIAEVIYAVSGRQDEDRGLDCGNNWGGHTLVSLFCGSCAVEAKLAKHFERLICNDAHPYLIAMWQALQRGWEPPDIVTEAEYQYIKDHKDEDPALAGFVGFGCAFGGKWFGGYARDKRGCGDTGYAPRSKASLLNVYSDMTHGKVSFSCLDYRDVIVPPGSVIYADPPYAGTTPYKGVAPFDSAAFWAYMRKLAGDGHIVYVSECTAPEDIPVVWEKEYGSGMKNGGITASKTKRIERLYRLG